MELLNCAHHEDYGHVWYLQLLRAYPKFALLDICIQWDEFPVTDVFPMLLVSFGSLSLMGFSFRWKWFEIRCDFFTFYPRTFLELF